MKFNAMHNNTNHNMQFVATICNKMKFNAMPYKIVSNKEIYLGHNSSNVQKLSTHDSFEDD